jgi:carboxypeptidase T
VVKGLIVAGLSGLALLLVPAVAPAQTTVAPAQGRLTAGAIRPFAVYGVSTREQRSDLVSEGYDIGERAWPNHVILYGTKAQALLLTIHGYRIVPQAPDDFPPPDSGYHNYAEMVADVQAFAAAHPTMAHVFSLGTSYEGRDLIGVRISDDATDNLSEPGVFYVGQHHAREHLTVEVVLAIMHQFLEKPQLSDLVHTRQIYIVPSLNPDGAEYDLTGDTYHYWRKNRQPYQGIYGTDNNRNYSYNWGCCGGSSGDPNSEIFRGPSAFSTPEDSRMRDFMLAHPNITTGISYHSDAELILYPYGYTYTDIPPDMTVLDHSTFVAMGARMHATIGYTAEQSSDLYITDGDWNDWMYGALHKYPITVELGGGSFYPPDEYIPVEVARNMRAAVFVAHIADCPPRIVGGTCSAMAALHAAWHGIGAG